MEAAFKALNASGQKCAMAYEPSSWIDLEQFSTAHNIPVASNNNGLTGWTRSSCTTRPCTSSTWRTFSAG